MIDSRLLRILMAGTFLFTFTLVGCGDDDADADDSADTTAESNGEDVAEGDGIDFEEMKEDMLEMNEKMYEIITGIESVEDVQDADDEIGELFDELAENIGEAMENPAGMQSIEQAMAQDPDIQEWDQKINTAMEELRTNHPDAAAEFDKVMQKHSMKIQQVMMEATQEMQELMEGQSGAPSEGAMPDDTAGTGE